MGATKINQNVDEFRHFEILICCEIFTDDTFSQKHEKGAEKILIIPLRAFLFPCINVLVMINIFWGNLMTLELGGKEMSVR